MSKEKRYLDGKIAIITGVTSGLGKHLARVFAARGAAVAGVARRAELGEQLGAEIGAQGGAFHFVCADVSREQDCRRLTEETIARFGRIDILINNAAITGSVAPVHATATEDWDQVFALNLRGAFLLAREALPHMRAQQGGVTAGLLGSQMNHLTCAQLLPEG